MNWFVLIALFSTSLLSGCVIRELNERQEERLRSHDAQITARFAAVTAAGVITTLSDPRFRAANVRAGMRDPYDFILNVGPGVYFLEQYDPSRIPVLFVHGIDGSPDNFRYLIERLDRQRFQAWVYYYPSGARLGLVAGHLAQTVLQVERHHRVTTLVVIAHSMGGLVARGFLLRHEPDRLHIPLFISLSTPWSGHSAAQIGLDLSPAAVRSWHDIAPASDYLQSLFYTQAAVRRSLPERTQHQLLFSFKKGSGSFGQSSDQVVTVASELRAEAQDEAAGVYGFDDTHTGILENPQVSVRVNKLLVEATLVDSFNPSAFTTLSTVARLGLPSDDGALCNPSSSSSLLTSSRARLFSAERFQGERRASAAAWRICGRPARPL